MKLQLIRNATLRLHYGGHLLLIDPFFAPKHAIDPFVGKERNPTSDLPIRPEQIMQDVELVLVSHLHRDHFDPLAQELLPKDWPIICQPGDEDKIAESGFNDITALQDSLTWKGIQITRTKGVHGSGVWAERMGNVMGFVLRAKDEPTVYWAGDTIWYEEVDHAIRDHQPDVIITHSGGAIFEANSPIIMDDAHTINVCDAAPDATVIAVHMEALDHCAITRAALRSAADAAGINVTRLSIPTDGETLELA